MDKVTFCVVYIWKHIWCLSSDILVTEAQPRNTMEPFVFNKMFSFVHCEEHYKYVMLEL